MTMVPDDKDWTWVLDRPCPDCSFDARDVVPEEVPARLRELASPWQKVLLRDDVAERPSPTTWSPLEYSCHVRDVLTVFNGRLEMMVAEDGAHFTNWDQDATAVEQRYDLQDPPRVSGELARAAEELAERFSHVDATQWGHRGLRSNGSEFTVATFAAYLVHDLIHHLWDVVKS